MQLRFTPLTIRKLMIAPAVVALCLSFMMWILETQFRPDAAGGPARIQKAAGNKIPGIIITSMRPETFGRQKAWEVRGIDQKGTIWLIDAADSGEVFLAEPVAQTLPPSVAEPIPDL